MYLDIVESMYILLKYSIDYFTFLNEQFFSLTGVNAFFLTLTSEQVYVQNICLGQQVEITSISKSSFPIFIPYFIEYYKTYKNYGLKHNTEML